VDLPFVCSSAIADTRTSEDAVKVEKRSQIIAVHVSGCLTESKNRSMRAAATPEQIRPTWRNKLLNAFNPDAAIRN
jgi:hypothetical protein